MLRKLKQDAERRLGQVSSAVITVPAYFDQVRRKATIRAAEQAGLKVQRIVNEPTAAAVAWLDAGGQPGTALIFDLGGGTFDVTVAKVMDGQRIDVIATGGSHRLGGVDFDRALAMEVDKRFKLLSGGVSLRSKLGESLGLESNCRDLKHKLSKRPTASLHAGTGAVQHAIEIGQSQFESLIDDYLSLIKMTIESVLDDAGLGPGDIDRVLLVGGSTRIPAVRALVKAMFGKDPEDRVHPDEAVALGAALMAGMGQAREAPQELAPAAVERLERREVNDIISWAIGTTVLDSHSQQMINDVLIPRNTTLPITETRTYFTTAANQTQVECDVTQAALDDQKSPEDVVTLARSLMTLPAGRAAGCEIQAVFSIDVSGDAIFKFVDTQSGKEEVFEINMGWGGSEEARANAAQFDDLVIR